MKINAELSKQNIKNTTLREKRNLGVYKNIVSENSNLKLLASLHEIRAKPNY